MARRLAATVLAGSLIAVSAATGAAAGVPTEQTLAPAGANHSTIGPIGGPLMGTSGVVVQPGAGAPPLPAPGLLPASSWLVANLTTGQVLAAKAPHARFLPASTLKMLTAVTLIPKLDPQEKFAATYKDATVDGTRVGLVPGFRYSIDKLFTCMLVDSANDAADALAEANGGIKRTVNQMNAEARELQAYDTTANTPSGLDGPTEASSAYDLALIAKAGLQLPAFRRYVSTVRTRVPAPHGKHFMAYTHNYLLTTFKGDIGVKNGYTVNAQATYVGAATRHGQTILVTMMHAYPNFWSMARALLTWGFNANGKVSPVGTLVDPLPPAGQVQPTTAPVAQAVTVTHTHGRKLSPIEVLIIAITIVVATVTGYRRIRPRRTKPRLRLPPI
jgi:D-alanyl-D-alanine carboxypeptidase (penicillin-binding protein 5/6)